MNVICAQHEHKTTAVFRMIILKEEEDRTDIRRKHKGRRRARKHRLERRGVIALTGS